MDFTHRESLLISGATRAQERLDATERQAQLAAAELGDLMPTLRRLSGGEAPAGELTGKARELAGVRLSLAQVRPPPPPPPAAFPGPPSLFHCPAFVAPVVGFFGATECAERFDPAPGGAA